MLGLVIAGVLVVLLVMSLFVRRYRERDVPQRGWSETSEVFRDPTTDRVLRVWVDGAGGRHYVPEGTRPPPG